MSPANPNVGPPSPPESPSPPTPQGLPSPPSHPGKPDKPKRPVTIGGKPVQPEDCTVTYLPNGRAKIARAGKPTELLARLHALGHSHIKRPQIDAALAALEQGEESVEDACARLQLTIVRPSSLL